MVDYDNNGVGLNRHRQFIWKFGCCRQKGTINASLKHIYAFFSWINEKIPTVAGQNRNID